jgi:hypothetical protein
VRHGKNETTTAADATATATSTAKPPSLDQAVAHFFSTRPLYEPIDGASTTAAASDLESATGIELAKSHEAAF